MMNNKLLIINIAKSGEKTERKEKWLARESPEPLHTFYTLKSKTIPKVHIVKLKGNKCKIYTAAVRRSFDFDSSRESNLNAKSKNGRDHPNGPTLCVCPIIEPKC